MAKDSPHSKNTPQSKVGKLSYQVNYELLHLKIQNTITTLNIVFLELNVEFVFTAVSYKALTREFSFRMYNR